MFSWGTITVMNIQKIILGPRTQVACDTNCFVGPYGDIQTIVIISFSCKILEN